MRRGFFLLIGTGIILFAITFVLIRYAQGYRLEFGKNLFQKNSIRLSPTGLLTATSTPDGASVYIEGHLTSATDTTIDLSPGTYTVRIVKEGYLPWEKKLTIQKEVVTQTQAVLFPAAPKLESLSSSGALSPTVDPSGTNIAFGVASASAARKNGIYVLSMTTTPILNLRNASLQIADDTNSPLSQSIFTWAPNGREMLIQTPTKTSSTYLLQSGQFNSTPSDVTATLNLTKTQWQREKDEIEKSRKESLKPELANFIQKNFHIIAWSGDDQKILYEASASASESTKIPQFITPPLIGANSQPESRQIQKGKMYVYDSKEDKNFLIKDVDPASPPVWFPDSRHLVLIEDREVKIMEYDGTNKTVVYSGPLVGNFVYPWPDGSRLVILTSLNQQGGITPNLYTINLK